MNEVVQIRVPADDGLAMQINKVASQLKDEISFWSDEWGCWASKMTTRFLGRKLVNGEFHLAYIVEHEG